MFHDTRFFVRRNTKMIAFVRYFLAETSLIRQTTNINQLLDLTIYIFKLSMHAGHNILIHDMNIQPQSKDVT